MDLPTLLGLFLFLCLFLYLLLLLLLLLMVALNNFFISGHDGAKKKQLYGLLTWEYRTLGENNSYSNLLITLDIDECSADSSPCDENADCTNTDGSYSCTCKQGFDGDGQSCEGTWLRKCSSTLSFWNWKTFSLNLILVMKTDSDFMCKLPCPFHHARFRRVFIRIQSLWRKCWLHQYWRFLQLYM